MFQVAFVDLDDTLFSSLHKHEGRTDLRPAALLRDGSVVSYASGEQRALGGWLGKSDLVVPVTARTAEAFRRVLLDFDGYAIVSHGATILGADRSSDVDWEARVDRSLVAELPALYDLLETLRSDPRDGPPLDVRIAGEPGRPAYLMAKDPHKDASTVLRASRRCVEPWIAAHPGYTHHLNGNNLAVLPPAIGKQAAVAYLIDRLQREHGELFVLGAGDSLTDAPFLSLCHAAVIPTRSQLWEAVLAVPETDLR